MKLGRDEIYSSPNQCCDFSNVGRSTSRTDPYSWKANSVMRSSRALSDSAVFLAMRRFDWFLSRGFLDRCHQGIELCIIVRRWNVRSREEHHIKQSSGIALYGGQMTGL